MLDKIKYGTVIKGNNYNYIIKKKCGGGGSSQVYTANRKFDNKICAIKVLKWQYDKDDYNLKRFKKEIEFQKKTDHNHIVKILDEGKYDGYKFYVMEFYPKNFRTILDDTSITVKKKLKYYLDICDALQYIHSQKIYYRDIKPDNFLFDEKEDKLLLADFGIAHFDDLSITREWEKLANFDYHAPEQRINTHEKIGTYTDIFSMGLILNEIFTNKVPFGTNYIKISNSNPLYMELDGLVEKMTTYDINIREHKIMNVINIVKYVVDKITNQVMEIKESFDDNMLRDIDQNTLDLCSTDLYLLDFLIHQNISVNKINHKYHSKYRYKVSDTIVNSILMMNICESVKEKFHYESGSFEIGNEIINLNCYEKANDTQIKKFSDIINSLKIFGDLEHLKKKSMKYFVELRDYHAKEVIEDSVSTIIPKKYDYKMMNFYDAYQYISKLNGLCNNQLYFSCYVEDISIVSNVCSEENLVEENVTLEKRTIELLESEYSSLTIFPLGENYNLIISDIKEKNKIIERCLNYKHEISDGEQIDVDELIKKINDSDKSGCEIDSYEIDCILIRALIK